MNVNKNTCVGLFSRVKFNNAPFKYLPPYVKRRLLRLSKYNTMNQQCQMPRKRPGIITLTINLILHNM